MSNLGCDRVQERIPDLVEGRVPEAEAGALRAHLAGCSECGEIAALVELLGVSRPVAPTALAGRVEQAVRSRGRSTTRPWWGLAAAAVAALALGIGVTSDRDPTLEVPAFVADSEASSSWFADDGVVAGAPTLGDLSEEALMTLLDEMGAGPSGGAA